MPSSAFISSSTGVLTGLFYRVWWDRADLSTLILPVLAGLQVGTADEAWQWFVPERVGEWRDIFINLGAIASGLLFSVAVAPPAALAWRLPGASRRGVGVAAAAVVLSLGAFLQGVHLGHVVSDADIGAFRSRYTGAELRALAVDRAKRWRRDPPPMTLRRFSREDQYLAEALWHVRARNDAWATDVTRAWHENRLLEAYFAPVLDVRSYLAPAGVRWPAEQRADAEERAGRQNPGGFVSHADPRGFVLVWPPAALWAGAAVLAAVFLAFGMLSPGPAKPLAPGP